MPEASPGPRTCAYGSVEALSDRLFETRRLSLDLVSPLSAEDMTAQAMEDASPAKWHLAHATWFFETFVLERFARGYRTFDPRFGYCFNSYYEAVGERQPRPRRGLMTRPSVETVLDYCAHADRALEKLLGASESLDAQALRVIEIGVNHQQQHQELLLTDILALFAAQPLRPAYRGRRNSIGKEAPEPIHWIDYAGGIHFIGHSGDGFAYDNESPRHQTLVPPFRLADRLVTNSEWLAFMNDGGYRTASLWLSDGWALVQRESWRAPLYWEQREDEWFAMTLDGPSSIEPAAPVAHVGYFEADAFARWAGARLPTEFEWEVAARDVPAAGNMLSARALRTSAPKGSFDGRPRQMFGDVWEWTQSAYAPYPGYRPPPGALGEYNGKFMVSQQTLRGASFATPDGHSRATYRNFFYPHQRWQFTGLRLASDLAP